MSLRFHVVGNTVFDLRLGQWPDGSDRADAWTSGNVLLADEPPVPMLGGGGAAAAYALGRLSHGLHTIDLNTRLGADLFGGLAHQWLVHAGVSPVVPPEPAVATSTHIIHAQGASRRSAFYRGHRVDWRRSLDAAPPDWFLAAGYGLVEAVDALDLSDVCARLAKARSKIVIDPGPWFAQNATPEHLAPLWPHVDVLVGTQEELSPYAVDSTDSGVTLACYLRDELGIGTVVVKQAAEGASWVGEQGEGQTSTQQIDGAYSVGAGDTFNARLIFGLARGDSLSDAVRAAVGLATRVVSQERGVLGAFGDDPTVEGLDSWS